MSVEFRGTGEIDAPGSPHDGTGGDIRRRTVDGIRERAAREGRTIESEGRRGEGMAAAAGASATVPKTCDGRERDGRKPEAACAAP